jgi:Zn-finger protein
MGRDPLQRYAESLEKTIRSNHHYLKETIKDFQEMCRMVTPERNVPPEIVLDIHEIYKEIRNRLTEIKAIEQVLQGKYRQYYHRDAMRDKEILEFGFIAKNCYSKFEYTMMQKEAQKKAKEREGVHRVEQKGPPCQWFHSKENQVTFIRNLRVLNDLDYEMPSNLETGERREVSPDRPRSLTLFVFSGDGRLIDDLQSRVPLREHDIMERYARDELHGLLAHLREIDPLEVEKKFKEFMGSGEFSKLKCLLFSVHSPKNLEGDLLGLIKKTLQGMREGELKTISI